MANIECWARHGAHKDNVLTADGILEVEIAAEYLADDLPPGTISVVLASSEVDRAIKSADIYRRALEAKGIKVIDLGPQAALNPAPGVLAAYVGNHTPVRHGRGFMAWWRSCPPSDLPDGCETVEQAGTPSASYAESLERAYPGIPRVLVAHGGFTIEPGILARTNGLVKIDDLPSAAFVALDFDAHSSFLFDPKEV
ncbi:MAG: histidine phosphatase family protein [Candidatus Magasanikiibacteriota bacterium]